MLLAPAWLECGGGLAWSKVTASSLIGVNENAEVVEGGGKPEMSTARIHLGIRRVKPEAK